MVVAKKITADIFHQFQHTISRLYAHLWLIVPHFFPLSNLPQFILHSTPQTRMRKWREASNNYDRYRTHE